jgi:hypothetical protein
MHDPNIFPDPDNFMPERFLETTDPCLQTFDLPFGWGRRICVLRAFSVAHLLTSLLHTGRSWYAPLSELIVHQYISGLMGFRHHSRGRRQRERDYTGLLELHQRIQLPPRQF